MNCGEIVCISIKTFFQSGKLSNWLPSERLLICSIYPLSLLSYHCYFFVEHLYIHVKHQFVIESMSLSSFHTFLLQFTIPTWGLLNFLAPVINIIVTYSLQPTSGHRAIKSWLHCIMDMSKVEGQWRASCLCCGKRPRDHCDIDTDRDLTI